MNQAVFNRVILSAAFLLLCAYSASASESSLPAEETIRYHIKKLGMKAGEASLEFRGPTVYDGQPVNLIVFKAQGFNFYDEEKIYVDSRFLPVAVERDLDIWGKKEKITERYDHEKGIIRIEKTVGNETTVSELKNDGPIENIYGFIFRFRNSETPNDRETFAINLPTRSVEMQVTERGDLRVGGQTYETYRMTSDPSAYTVWFSTGEQRIPLRIDGALGFGKTSMVMVGYHDGPADEMEDL